MRPGGGPGEGWGDATEGENRGQEDKRLKRP